MEHRRRLYDAGVLLVLTALAGAAIGSGALLPATRLAGDAMLRWVGALPPPLAPDQPEVVLVAIDPQSLRAAPDWPWPRTLHARAVRNLHAAGAKAIAFDVDFSTPRGDAADAALVRAVEEAGNVVLAAFRQLQPLPGGASLEIANTPFPELAGAAAAVGSVHMQVDPDGVLRRSPHSVEIGGVPRPSLAETTLDLATGRPADPTGSGSFLVDYRRAQPGVPTLPMIDVIEGRFDPRDVAGRAVLIGATAAEFQDLWATPLGPARPGVWIQAVALRTAAAQRTGQPVLRAPSSGAQTATVAGLLLLAAALGWLGERLQLPRWASLAAQGCLACGFGGVSLALLQARGLLLEPVVPLAALALQHGIGLERVRRRFGARIEVGERSIATLARVGEATAAPIPGDAGLGIALGLLGDVVDASAVALLRAAPGAGLDGRRLDWRRRGQGAIGDPALAQEVLEGRQVRLFEGALPGSGLSGRAVYSPLHAGPAPLGVLIVEREGSRPLDETELRTIATVSTQLTLSAHNLVLLEDLRTTFDSSIEAIACAVEARDGYTEQHCRRLAAFSTLMAERLGLEEEEVEAIRLGALLHDVGKVGIRDEILLKPGRFDSAERNEMRSHAALGHGIIRGIHGLRPSTLACVRHHHERWDGSGYPDGLGGEEIALGARIVAIVDVWDALSTERPYKPALDPLEVRQILLKGRGSHLDARLVDLFLQLLDDEGEELLQAMAETPGGAP